MVTGGAFACHDGVGMLVLGCSFWGGAWGLMAGSVHSVSVGVQALAGGVTSRCFHLSRLYIRGCVSIILGVLWLGLRGVAVCLLVS